MIYNKNFKEYSNLDFRIIKIGNKYSEIKYENWWAYFGKCRIYYE